AVLVLHQREKRGAVRIVFEPIDRRRHVELAPLEVDHAVGLLVAAAAEAHGGAAGIVAAAVLVLALGQRLDRLALVERGAIDEHQLTLARRGRVVILERHLKLSLTARWSRRCGDPPRGSRSPSSRPTARRAGRETPCACPCAPEC